MASLPRVATAPETDKFTPRSRFIELVTFDRQSNTMDITFKSGSVRKYLYCFPSTFETFKQSPTHDAYYSRGIRGRLTSVAIREHTIGRAVKTPLKQPKQRKTLDEGRKDYAGKKWIAGTLNRTFAGLQSGIGESPTDG